jgi:hypothetical protein
VASSIRTWPHHPVGTRAAARLVLAVAVVVAYLVFIALGLIVAVAVVVACLISVARRLIVAVAVVVACLISVARRLVMAVAVVVACLILIAIGFIVAVTVAVARLVGSAVLDRPSACLWSKRNIYGRDLDTRAPSRAAIPEGIIVQGLAGARRLTGLVRRIIVGLGLEHVPL